VVAGAMGILRKKPDDKIFLRLAYQKSRKISAFTALNTYVTICLLVMGYNED